MKLVEHGVLGVKVHDARLVAIMKSVGAGQSTYHRFNTGGGIIFPQFNLSAYQELFQIFNRRQKIVDGPNKP